jgi:hypothetical protein
VIEMDFKAGIYDASGSGITGSTDLVIKIKRDADNYFYDFDDSTFKASGWTTISDTFSEVNASVVPGEYEYNLDTSGFSDGIYTAYVEYTGSQTTAYRDKIEFICLRGKDFETEILVRWIRNAQGFSGSNMILYDDDNSTPLLTWPITQGSLAVSPPLNRGKAT